MQASALIKDKIIFIIIYEDTKIIIIVDCVDLILQIFPIASRSINIFCNDI